MAINNLLSLTSRNNVNYEAAITVIKQVYGGALNVVQYVDTSDSISIDGKITNILGNLTDEQIEKIMKMDLNRATNNMVDIITTCQDITDEELIDVFLNKTNYGSEIQGIEYEKNPTKENTPLRLHLIRQNVRPFEPADTDSDSNTDPDDNADGLGPSSLKPSTKDLYRGDSEWSTTISSSETVLTLKNPFMGSNYQYTITSLSGNQNAKFEFLANGRLLITGDNIKVVASENQKDDIILIGSNNELSMEDADDTVRVGVCIDSKVYGITTNNGLGGMTFEDEFGNSNTFYQTTGNKINTGSGNDYITMLGTNYSINAGSGNDKIRMMFSEIISSNISSVEDLREYDTQKAGTLDGLDGWACQANIPDCRFFALINSIAGYGNKNKGNISWANIQDNGTYYTVTFPNYPDSSKNSIKVYKNGNDGISVYDGVYGDLDTIIISKALNLIIARNHDRYGYIDYNNGYYADDSVTNAYYNTISKYVTGSEEITYLKPTGWSTKDGSPLTCEQLYGADYRTCFSDLWNKYKSGEISNFNIGMASENKSLGIISGHAYSVEYYDETAGYIVLTNPWDDADCVKLSLNDFFALDTEVIIYGTDIYDQGILIPNGGSISVLSSQNDVQIECSNIVGYYGNNLEIAKSSNSQTSPNHFTNLFNSSEDTIYDEINIITEKFEAVKQILDKPKRLTLFS